jgi:hypothetical protein
VDPKESEGFWPDPNLKKKFGYGFRSRYCSKIKIIPKNHRLNTLKGTKCMFFAIAKLFFCFTGSGMHMKAMRATL